VKKEQRWANCSFAHHFKKGDKINLFGNKVFYSFSKSEVLTWMLMKIPVLWDTMPCMTESYLREFEQSTETLLDRSNQSLSQCFVTAGIAALTALPVCRESGSTHFSVNYCHYYTIFTNNTTRICCKYLRSACKLVSRLTNTLFIAHPYFII